jgi:hypothetical protein
MVQPYGRHVDPAANEVADRETDEDQPDREFDAACIFSEQLLAHLVEFIMPKRVE